MSIIHSSFGKLQQFVNNIHSKAHYVIDPYNTFMCEIEMVNVGEADSFKTELNALHNHDIDNIIQKSGGCMKSNKITKDIHHLIEDINISGFSSKGNSQSLLHGKYQEMFTYPILVSGSVDIKFLNIAPRPIIETVIYPWMAACSGVGPKNSESPSLTDLDYPRADLTIIFPHLYEAKCLKSSIPTPLNNENEKITISNKIPYYKFYNIRPVEADSISPSNKAHTELYRKVTFAFDYFAVLEDSLE